MVTGDTALQSTVLEDLAGAVRYRDWQVALAQPWLGEDPLEIGAGLGDHAEAFAARGVRLTASEADPTRLRALEKRFAGRCAVRVRRLTVPIAETGSYSAVVAFNVLEHIADDVAALRDMAGLVRPGGHAILFVPAFAAAMSRFDRAIGHQRRYRRVSLTAAIEAAGLIPAEVRYVNAPGLLAWIVGMRLLGMTPRSGPLLVAWDRLVIPLVRRVEGRFSPPFGQSLFAVARRPG